MTAAGEPANVLTDVYENNKVLKEHSPSIFGIFSRFRTLFVILMRSFCFREYDMTEHMIFSVAH